jgi:hypothetical protein
MYHVKRCNVQDIAVAKTTRLLAATPSQYYHSAALGALHAAATKQVQLPAALLRIKCGRKNLTMLQRQRCKESLAVTNTAGNKNTHC